MTKTVASICEIVFQDGSELLNVSDDYPIEVKSLDFDCIEDDSERETIENRLIELTEKKYGKAVKYIGWGVTPDWDCQFGRKLAKKA